MAEHKSEHFMFVNMWPEPHVPMSLALCVFAAAFFLSVVIISCLGLHWVNDVPVSYLVVVCVCGGGVQYGTVQSSILQYNTVQFWGQSPNLSTRQRAKGS
jgi:hypothetical protein